MLEVSTNLNTWILTMLEANERLHVNSCDLEQPDNQSTDVGNGAAYDSQSSLTHFERSLQAIAAMAYDSQSSLSRLERPLQTFATMAYDSQFSLSRLEQPLQAIAAQSFLSLLERPLQAMMAEGYDDSQPFCH